MIEVIIYLGADVDNMVQCLYAKWVMEIVKEEVRVTEIVNKKQGGSSIGKSRIFGGSIPSLPTK
jgi:hypothetical protein